MTKLGIKGISFYLLMFYLVSPTFMLVSAEQEEISTPIISIDFNFDEIVDSIKDVIYMISKLPEKFVNTLLKRLASGMVDSLGEIAESAIILNLEGISDLISGALQFIKNLTFILAELSFIIGIGLFISPSRIVSQELAARGRQTAFNSVFVAFLTNFQSLIISFFRTLSTALTNSIKNVPFPSLSEAIVNAFTNLSLNMFVLTWLLYVTSLVIIVILSCAFLLESISPIVFSLSLLIYSLPFGDEVANRLAISSLIYLFLKPITWSIIILDAYILTEIASILTPFIICVFDLTIFWLLFQVSKSMGAQYPILDQLSSALERGISLGIAYAVASSGILKGG